MYVIKMFFEMKALGPNGFQLWILQTLEKETMTILLLYSENILQNRNFPMIYTFKNPKNRKVRKHPTFKKWGQHNLSTKTWQTLQEKKKIYTDFSHDYIF